MPDEPISSAKLVSVPEWHRQLLDRTAANELIWHYCSWKGLRGIIEKEVLWASNARYLNDSREIVQSGILIEPYLTDTKHKALRERMREIVSPHLVSEPLSVFVVSFSKAFDSLGQWRGYSGPGPSFSIGFKRLELKQIASNRNFRLMDCAYDEDDIRNAVQETLGNVDAARAASHVIKDGQQRLVSPGAGANYMHGQFIEAQILAAQIKHYAFRDEKEVRLIGQRVESSSMVSPLDGKAFERGSMIVPYVEVPIRSDTQTPPLPIDTILVGPTVHPELTISVTKQLVGFLNGNISDARRRIKVEYTLIPYRNW